MSNERATITKGFNLPVYGRQHGAVTVESAITLLVFVVIILAIMEFSILIYRVSSIADATRVGARYLSVNEPLVANLSETSCSDLSTPHQCSSACEPMLELMRRSAEGLQESNVYYQYNCTDTGYDEAPFKIYSLNVWVEGIQHHFITPGLAVLGMELPKLTATRLSEDLETVDEDD